MKQIIDDVLSALFIILTGAVLAYWEWLPDILEELRWYLNL